MSYDFIDQMLDKARSGELRSPVAELLGMHLVEYGRGEAVYEMAAREQLGNSLGLIRGGIATALADMAMAAASTSLLDDDEIRHTAITMIDMFARFMQPVSATDVETFRAQGKVVRTGALLVWTEADVLADGDLAGRFTATAIRVSLHSEPRS